MTTVDGIRRKYAALAGVMDERMTRLWVAAEAEALGYGGTAAVTKATGILGKRIRAGMEELAALRKSLPVERPRAQRVLRAAQPADHILESVVDHRVEAPHHRA